MCFQEYKRSSLWLFLCEHFVLQKHTFWTPSIDQKGGLFMGRQPSESQRDSTLCLSKNTDLEWLFERFFSHKKHSIYFFLQ